MTDKATPTRDMRGEDHKEIWLQNPADIDGEWGRQWCEDKVWPDQPEDGEPTRYVRADLYDALRAEIERLRAALDAENKRPWMFWFAEDAETPIDEEEIGRELGAGGVAEIWSARQMPTSWVAVHTFDEDGDSNMSWHSTEAEARAALAKGETPPPDGAAGQTGEK